MKQGTVKYSQEFITPTGLKRWIGIEYPIDFDTEDFLAVYNKVKAMVLDCNDSAPPYTEQPSQIATSTELPVINRASERLLVLIDNADSFEKLYELEKYAKISGDQSIIDAWNNKYNQLLKKK